LRIIGGRLRGSKLASTGVPTTRPMKDRVREAVFNLIGPSVVGKHAIDLFAGSGALGLEAISRGAGRATMIERNFPAAEVIRRNVAALSVRDMAEVIVADTFVWARRLPALGDVPWVVFCSPPYSFYVERTHDIVRLVDTLLGRAPAGSLFVVEADDRFDFGILPDSPRWDVRHYLPAVVGLYRLPHEDTRVDEPSRR
jgi:16S rRNA (guanine966-N2)-methyltransferase